MLQPNKSNKNALLTRSGENRKILLVMHSQPNWTGLLYSLTLNVSNSIVKL